MVKVNSHELIPSAKRLITSLRDMGYDFSAAVADLVDNSIEARASRIAITAQFLADDSWIRIADNGNGMSPAQLREALRYGAEREYEDADLGRFGLGLKTASMSQCQRLSVASRVNPNRADIAAYCWDLDHIMKTNKWEILPLKPEGSGAVVCEPLREGKGTSVLWQRLDRLLGYEHPYGEFARKRMSAMCRELELHLGMVFHRFIAKEVKGRALSIALNGNDVRPWDPFFRSEPQTKVLDQTELRLEYEGVKGTVSLQPFILPHQLEFSSSEEFRRASGPLGWNQQQGFYIYRADRLIQSGGWCRLRTQDEHTKLARVALSFPPKLDAAFKINVAKMRVQLPAQLRDAIESAIRPVIKAAQERYRSTSKKPGYANAAYELKEAAKRPSAEQASAMYRRDHAPSEKGWSLGEIESALYEVAGPGEKPVIRRVMAKVRRRLAGQ